MASIYKLAQDTVHIITRLYLDRLLLQVYNGSNASKLWGNFLRERRDEWNGEDTQPNIQPIVHCLRKFSKAKECALGLELDSNIQKDI